MDESSDSSDAELIHDMPELHNNSDPGSDDDEEIDIHEENNIPHPKDHADLVHWLKLSDEHLASLHTSSAPLQRGSYHSTKIGKNLSVRQTQELRKAKKERVEREKKEDKRHGLKTSNLHHFFSLARPIAREPEPEISETPEPEVEDRLLAMDDMDIDPSVEFSDEEPVQEPVQVVVDKTLNTADSVAVRVSCSKATIEDILDEDEDNAHLSVEPVGSVPKQWLKKVSMNYLGIHPRIFLLMLWILQHQLRHHPFCLLRIRAPRDPCHREQLHMLRVHRDSPCQTDLSNPELNFIEQCWGYAKRIYRMFPPSSKEEDLTRNMLEALDSVPLIS
ncbi:hypothetical protein B0H13DRAFT_2395179, partial [Mycena leptocephala]